MGSLFLRGKVWWVKYYNNGKCFRESSESTLKMVAKKMLARKEGEIWQFHQRVLLKALFSSTPDKLLHTPLTSGFIRNIYGKKKFLQGVYIISVIGYIA
jgi:hypothetical protein